MGKNKSNIPSCHVIFKKKENTPGVGTIYLRLTLNGRSTKKSLEIDIKENEWDEKDYIKSSVPELLRNEYKFKIDTEVLRVKKQLYEYKGELTFDIVQQMLHGDFISKDKKIRELDFIEYCKKVQDTKRISEKTRYNREKLINTFDDFFQRTHNPNYVKNPNSRLKIHISDITPVLIDEYIKWRTERNPKTSSNTTIKALVPIVQGVESLFDEDMIDHHICVSIQKRYQVDDRVPYKSNPQEIKVKYLVESQIQKFLEIYQKETRKTTIQYMEMFLFSMYTGLRASDIITLEWDHIKDDGRIFKMMVKTREEINEFLTEDSLKILDKWRGRNSKFVFDLLPEDFDIENTKDLWKIIDSKNRSIRQSLNIIGRRMGLNFNLGLHTARHTFTVLCLESGEDIYSVSKSLGHTSIKSTEQTYSDILESRKKRNVESRKQSFSKFTLPEK